MSLSSWEESLMSESLGSRADAVTEVILTALAIGATHAEAAALASVSTKSVQRRLGDPAFAAELARRRAVRLDDVTGRLTGLATTALDVIADLMESGSPVVRLRAAEQALQWLTRMRRQVDVEARLALLEGTNPGFVIEVTDNGEY